MKNRLITFTRRSASTAILAAALAPVFVFAQSTNSNSNVLQNPAAAAGVNSIQGFIEAFLKAVVEIALPILTIFFVYAGFKFVFARGNPEGIKEAKRNFLYVVIGAIFILGAWTLATLIGGTVSQVLGS